VVALVNSISAISVSARAAGGGASRGSPSRCAASSYGAGSCAQTGGQTVGERGLDHQHLDLAGDEQVFDLGAAVVHVHRHDDGADQEGGVLQEDELGGGFQHQADFLALADPGRGQAGGARLDVAQQVGIGPGSVLEYQRELVGLNAGLAQQDVGAVVCGGSHHRASFGTDHHWSGMMRGIRWSCAGTTIAVRDRTRAIDPL
jgi:hypothetical protein